jgi:hypothetical protein
MPVHFFRLQGEEDIVVSDITRALIKSLPRLFSKHQTDEARIAVVLSIPLLMNLDLYLEMRMTAVGRPSGIPFAKADTPSRLMLVYGTISLSS